MTGAVSSGRFLKLFMSAKSFIIYPWEIRSGKGESTVSEGMSTSVPWCFQIVVDREVKVVNAASGKPFPEHQISQDKKVVEFPGPAIKGDMSQSITLEIDNSESSTLLFSEAHRSVQNPRSLEQFEPFFDSVMNGILFLTRDCLNVEKFKVENVYWSQILSAFNAKDDNDPAKYSLIVDLARPTELFAPLKRITDRPKKVLRRIHDQERVQKVQEIDTKCLTDLARRPGTVLPEKAGPKQRILAIKRTESINILENRVAKHCCTLASRASQRYLREHEMIAPLDSPRKRDVSKLLRSSHQLPLKNSFQGVTDLIEPCRQPNYTLMQNADYYKVWKAYVQLVRNEDLRHELWKWNRRMWSDFLSLYLAQLVSSYQDSKQKSHIQMIGDKTVFGRRRQTSGKWFITDTLPGPFIIDRDSEVPATLYLIHGDYESLLGLSKDLLILASLNADYLFISSKGGQLSVLPIYAILPSHHLIEASHANYIEGILPSLMKNSRRFNDESSKVKLLGSWVLLGNWGQRTFEQKAKNLNANLSTWVTCVSPDYSFWKSSSDDAFEPIMTICGV